MSQNTKTGYSDHGPMALECWQSGPHSYDHAFKVAKERVGAIDNKQKRKMAESALYSRLINHSVRNNSNLSRIELSEPEREAYSDILNGEAPTPEYVDLLRQYPLLGAVEIARLIHPGDWDVRQYIDDPVRSALADPQAGLDTKFPHTNSHYKIVQFGKLEGVDTATVERKRAVMSHFGGSVMTVVRNTFLLDANHLDGSLRKHIRQERKNATRDYGEHSDVVHHEFEKHVRVRETDSKPRWAIPLMTTYYSYGVSDSKEA